MAQVVVHPDLAGLSFLLGTWRGEGEGTWPGGDPFTFGEEVAFEHVGEPYLLYQQRSWEIDDGGAIHLERGFLRPSPSGRIELVLAHPLGVAEVAEGTVHGPTLEVATTAVALTSTGSPVTELRRRLRVDGDVLTYDLDMATRDVALVSHIRSRLVRA
jgi:hypothetical protein